MKNEDNEKIKINLQQAAEGCAPRADNSLEAKLKCLPEKSGVYLMYDASGSVIYVGKAVVLKNRVRQYFNNSVKLPKVQAMVDSVADFGYIITLSEKDALSLEANLVKKYMPKYNILLKDDKASPYIRIDMREDFPTVEITRKIRRDGAKYYGPYLNGLRVKEIVAVIKAAYKMRACPKKFPKRECLDYHIGLCSGPCTKKVTKEEYRAACERVAAFLTGRDDEAERLITQKMNDASEAEEFERAIEYRAQLEMLSRLKERNIADLGTGDDIDSIAYVTDGLYGAASVNIVRDGKMMGVKNFVLLDAAISPADSLSSFVIQYYSANPIPSEVCFNTVFDTAPIREYLTAQRGGAVTVTLPQKGAKKRLVEMAEQNAGDFLLTSVEKARRDEDMTTGAAERLRGLLGLKSARRIECYDISNISGTDTVASGVVFIDGSPQKSLYRRYKIRTVQGSDDFASMREVIFRRFRDGDAGNEPPDLVVIDGGKGQLSSAISAMRECNAHYPVISLAEREELVFLPDKTEPLSLSKSDYALRLLIRLRDEAHRFAVSYHHTLRQTRYRSELMKINGVGAAKREKLIKSLTFKEIKTLSAEEIAAKSGLDLKTAKSVADFFNKP